MCNMLYSGVQIYKKTTDSTVLGVSHNNAIILPGILGFANIFKQKISNCISSLEKTCLTEMGNSTISVWVGSTHAQHCAEELNNYYNWYMIKWMNLIYMIWWFWSWSALCCLFSHTMLFSQATGINTFSICVLSTAWEFIIAKLGECFWLELAGVSKSPKSFLLKLVWDLCVKRLHTKLFTDVKAWYNALKSSRLK